MIQEVGKLEFFNVFKKYGLTDIECNLFYYEILVKYSSVDRYYHDLKHLDRMFQSLSQIKDQIIDWPSVVLSVMYHDIIYDPTRRDNEEASAEHAKHILGLIKCDEETINKVVSFIIATKNHGDILNTDGDFFLDADLAILGVSNEEYEEYSKNIRLEYSMFDDEQYKEGRISVLNSILASPRIYKTKYFFDNFEAKARLNLSNEIVQLQNGISIDTSL